MSSPKPIYVVAALLLSVGGCAARFQANARSSTTSGSTADASATSNADGNRTAAAVADPGGAGSSSSFQARGSAHGSVNVQGRGNASASGQGRGRSDGATATPPSDAITSRTVTAAPRQLTFTAPPRPEVRPAARPPAFRGRVMIASRRAARARGRAATPPPVVATPTPITPTPIATPVVTPPPVVTTAAPVAPPTPVAPPVVATPEPEPEPAPPAAPIPVPSTPPENVFGYDRPVLGCFEGQVYFIPNNSQRLPRNYADLESSAVLYACEWDIPTRAWEQGFPGLSERFEWFAIRYDGAFNIATAGKYRFRLSSDDGAKVTIDGHVVIDNDGVHPPQEKSGQAQLSAGDHTMVIEYFQGPRYHINLQLFVTPPDGQEGVFSVRPQ